MDNQKSYIYMMEYYIAVKLTQTNEYDKVDKPH